MGFPLHHRHVAQESGGVPAPEHVPDPRPSIPQTGSAVQARLEVEGAPNPPAGHVVPFGLGLGWITLFNNYVNNYVLSLLVYYRRVKCQLTFRTA